jgi:hypothetical protein
MKRSQAFQTIAVAGLVAGILDITSAFVIWALKGVAPTRGLQGIASGLLGQQSFEGGLATAGLGFAIHFFIAFAVTSAFYLASRKLAFLVQHAVISGVIYGVAIYGLMYWVVMPLASIKVRHSLSTDVTAILVHISLIGLPIALIVRRFSGARVSST